VHEVCANRERVVHWWRKPANKGEGFAPVSVRVSPTHHVASILLVKSEVNPRHKPSELNDDVGTLKSDDSHNGRECQVGHGKSLYSGLDDSHDLHLMFRNDLRKCYKNPGLESHLAMILHSIKEEISILSRDKLYPIERKRNDIRDANANDDELDGLDSPPYPFQIS